jgi:hypothetical protein
MNVPESGNIILDYIFLLSTVLPLFPYSSELAVTRHGIISLLSSVLHTQSTCVQNPQGERIVIPKWWKI